MTRPHPAHLLPIAPFAILALVSLGCEKEDSSDDGARRGSSSEDPSDGGTSSNGGDADPTGGRDDDAASCFAACQNTAFSCQPKGGGTISTADLFPDANGCTGTLTTDGAASALKVDCLARQICTGADPAGEATACGGATYSAFSFAFTPTGADGELVCTRN